MLTPGWRLGCALTLALGGGPALAQTAPKAPARTAISFPSNLQHDTLAAWLRRDTDLPPDAVVAISPLAVIAITETRPMASPEGFEVNLRAETVDEGFSRQEGLASWNATMKLACKDRTFSMGAVTGHSERNLKGEARAMQTALVGWNPVTPGTMQGEIWNARCAGDFRGPLSDAGSPKPAAQTQIAAANPTPPIAKPPPPAPVTAPAPVAPQDNTPALRPAIGSPPSAKPALATPPAKPAAPAFKPPVGNGHAGSVQILSAPTPEEASQALARLKSRLGAEMGGLKTSVVPVIADGKPRHRAIVSGFVSSGEASRFCEKVVAAGGKCLVRGDAGRAASEKAP